MNEQQLDKLLAGLAIFFVETRRQRAVEIEHAQDAAVLDQRHDELGARFRVAGDVPWEIVDIGHQKRCAARRGSPANAFADRDSHAGRLSLERTEHQLPAVAEIKPGQFKSGNP